MPSVASALAFFERASHYVTSSDLAREVEWQRRVQFEEFTESDLLRESAWVILCSGFRESVVRGIFDFISLCFCDWESATSILLSRGACRCAAMSVLKSPRKLNAILTVAERIESSGFAALKAEILQDPLDTLETFPFIGPITKLHLAKNLGLNVAKPDRHLVRLGDRFGFGSPEDLCSFLSQETGEPIKVVDLILWRFVADGGEACGAH